MNSRLELPIAVVITLLQTRRQSIEPVSTLGRCIVVLKLGQPGVAVLVRLCIFGFNVQYNTDHASSRMTKSSFSALLVVGLYWQLYYWEQQRCSTIERFSVLHKLIREEPKELVTAQNEAAFLKVTPSRSSSFTPNGSSLIA